MDRVRGSQQGIGGSIQRREASEGSLSLTVAISLNSERSRRGDGERREHESVVKGGRGGSESFSRGESGGE